MDDVGRRELRQGPTLAIDARRSRGSPLPLPQRPGRALAVSDDELLAIGDRALARLERGEAEVVIVDESSELTRFAGNEIHQSVAERSRYVRVRLIDEGRIGVGEVRGHLGDAVERALASAEQSRRVTTTAVVSPLSRPDATDEGPADL